MTTRRSQSGFALLIVLFLLAISAVLSYGYLMAATTRITASQNLLQAARAQSLAESGIEHAMFVLYDDPDRLIGSIDNPLGPYPVEGQDGSYTFYAVEDAESPGQYDVMATATMGDMTRTSRVRVLVQAAAMDHQLEHGISIGGWGASFPWYLDVEGDVYVDGPWFANMAAIDGNVTCTGYVFDWLGRITGSVINGADPMEVPDLDMEDYLTYRFSDTPCSALSKFKKIESGDEVCDGGAISPANVGGVVHLYRDHQHQDVKIKSNVDFRGTIVSNHDIVIKGRNIHIEAQAGFPAIVTSGSIKIDRNAEVTINGLVVAKQGIKPGSHDGSGSRTTINGGIISDWNGYRSDLEGYHELIFDAERTQLYDFSDGEAGSGAGATVRIIGY